MMTAMQASKLMVVRAMHKSAKRIAKVQHAVCLDRAQREKINKVIELLQEIMEPHLPENVGSKEKP